MQVGTKFQMFLSWITFAVVTFIIYGAEINQIDSLPGLVNKHVSVCYNSSPNVSQFTINCETNTQIVLTSAYHGFENEGAVCTPNDMNGDCLQEDNEQHSSLSGHSDGIFQCADATPKSCNASVLQLASPYCNMSYQCISGGDVFEICSDGISSDKDIVYLQSRAYTSSGILPTDTACSCSVETSSFTDIHMFIIEMNLDVTMEDCKQSITISNRTDVLKTFVCQPPKYNFLQNITIHNPYINISMVNTLSVSGGRFWLGFKAKDENAKISIRCPSQHQTKYLDCAIPNTTAKAHLNYTGTSYQSTATYTCVSGYFQLSGNETRTCLENSSWSGEALECVYECHEPPKPEGGDRTFSGTVPGSTVTYTCNANHTLTGSLMRHCVEGHGWNGTDTTCHKDCNDPDSGRNTVVNISGYSYLSTVNYTCERNYSLVSGNETRTCRENATWSGQPLNCLYECHDPPKPDGGNMHFSGTVSGYAATYYCNDNHTLKGSLIRHCVEGQGWNGTETTCHKGCDDLGSGRNSFVNMTENTNISMVMYTCNTGFSPVSGNTTRTCLENATWSGQPLNCLYECHDPPNPDGGERTYNGTVAGHTATYTCNANHTLVGSSIRHCVEGTGWNGTETVCHKDCNVPPKGIHSNVTFSGTTYLSTATYTCLPGYSPDSGNETRTCRENATWTGQPLNCLYECHEPPYTNGGDRNYSGTVSGNTAIYKCNVNYTLQGSSIRHCVDRQGWNGTETMCHKDCNPPAIASNSNVTFSGTSYLSTAFYTCFPGYSPDSGNDTRTCRENATWTGQPLHCLYDCHEPSKPEGGDRNFIGTVSGHTATYKCNVNHTLVGSLIRHCVAGQGWNGTETICHKDCPSPDNVSNSNVEFSGTSYLSTARYTCFGGYFPVSGNENRTCQENASWTGHPLKCLYECLEPPVLDNGERNFNRTLTGDTVSYNCHGNHTLVGDSVRHCLDGIGWSGNTPKCYRDCPELHSSTNLTVTTSGTSYNSIATYTCQVGYILTGGDVTRVCQSDGTWNGTQPFCVTGCSKPTGLANGDITMTGSFPGDMATYTCKEGYTIFGNTQLTCSKDGLWNGTLPECKENPGPRLTALWIGLGVVAAVVVIIGSGIACKIATNHRRQNIHLHHNHHNHHNHHRNRNEPHHHRHRHHYHDNKTTEQTPRNASNESESTHMAHYSLPRFSQDISSNDFSGHMDQINKDENREVAYEILDYNAHHSHDSAAIKHTPRQAGDDSGNGHMAHFALPRLKPDLSSGDYSGHVEEIDKEENQEVAEEILDYNIHHKHDMEHKKVSHTRI